MADENREIPDQQIMQTPEGRIRERIHVTGTVQGVGFRYRASHAANGLRLSGWVRNEWDGSVLMEVQGREAEINLMLKQINMSPYIRIDWLDRKRIPVQRDEGSFHVR